jgi:sugar lactone lactonase YvrE
MIRSFVLSTIFSLTAFTPTNTPEVIEVQADKELIPEGIAVHPQTGTIYLSSLHQNKIVAVDKEGKVQDLIASNAEGYMMGLGIKLDKEGRTLWTVSSYNDSTTHKTGLFQIDLRNGRVLQKFLRTEQKDCFLNDLVIDKAGNIYITDTQQSSVFRWSSTSKRLERWVQADSLLWANGIALSPDEKTLFVASGRYGIQMIDIATKKMVPIAGENTDFYAIDGLVYYQNSLIGVRGWPQNTPQNHRVLRFHLKSDNTLSRIDTLDINNPHINTPTTLAVTGDQLYVLARTNLGVYNRHNSKTENIKDSLQNAIVLKYTLKD